MEVPIEAHHVGHHDAAHHGVLAIANDAVVTDLHVLPHREVELRVVAIAGAVADEGAAPDGEVDADVGSTADGRTPAVEERTVLHAVAAQVGGHAQSIGCRLGIVVHEEAVHDVHTSGHMARKPHAVERHVANSHPVGAFHPQAIRLRFGIQGIERGGEIASIERARTENLKPHAVGHAHLLLRFKGEHVFRGDGHVCRHREHKAIVGHRHAAAFCLRQACQRPRGTVAWRSETLTQHLERCHHSC